MYVPTFDFPRERRLSPDTDLRLNVYVDSDGRIISFLQYLGSVRENFSFTSPNVAGAIKNCVEHIKGFPQIRGVSLYSGISEPRIKRGFVPIIEKRLLAFARILENRLELNDGTEDSSYDVFVDNSIRRPINEPEDSSYPCLR